MTDALKLADELDVHEERMGTLFDMIVALRDKQTDPETHAVLNSMKYVLSGRPPCVDEARDTLRAQEARIEELTARLTDLYDLCTFGSSPKAFHNGVTDSTGSIDEGDYRAGEYIRLAAAALRAGKAGEGEGRG